MKNCNNLDKYKEFFNVVGFLNLQRIELTSKPQLIQFFIDNMLLAIINSHVNMLEIYTQKPSHTQHIYTHIYVHCIYIFIYILNTYHTLSIYAYIYTTHTHVCLFLPSSFLFSFCQGKYIIADHRKQISQVPIYLVDMADLYF